MALVSAVTIAVFVVMRGTGGQCEGTTDRRAICEEQVPQVVVDDVARWLGVGRIAHRVGGAGNGQLSAIVSEEAYLLKLEKVACGSRRQLSFWIRRLQQKVRGACTPGTRTDVKTNLKLSVAGGQFRRKLHDTSMLRTRCRAMEKRRGRASRACSWRRSGCPLDLPPDEYSITCLNPDEELRRSNFLASGGVNRVRVSAIIIKPNHDDK